MVRGVKCCSLFVIVREGAVRSGEQLPSYLNSSNIIELTLSLRRKDHFDDLESKEGIDKKLKAGGQRAASW